MNKRCKFLTIALVCLLGGLPTSLVRAEPWEVARYDLTLCGYRLGMSYDEAAAVRPIQRVAMTRLQPDGPEILQGFVDNTQVDDLELRFQLSFAEGRLYKVVARISPLQFDTLHQHFLAAYGKAADLSRELQGFDGSTRRQTTFRWDFPGARIFLLQSSANAEYATASLLGRAHSPPPSADQNDRQPGS